MIDTNHQYDKTRVENKTAIFNQSNDYSQSARMLNNKPAHYFTCITVASAKHVNNDMNNNIDIAISTRIHIKLY